MRFASPSDRKRNLDAGPCPPVQEVATRTRIRISKARSARAVLRCRNGSLAPGDLQRRGAGRLQSTTDTAEQFAPIDHDGVRLDCDF